MAQQICISADSHVVEPPEVFEPVAKKFGDGTPRVVYTEEKGYEFDDGRGRRGTVGGFATAGLDPHSKEYEEAFRRGYDVAPALRDGKSRVAAQERDGVDAELLYPSILLGVFRQQEDNTEVVKAIFRSYNDWLANYAKDAPGRLFPLACVQLHDIDEAISEMTRAKKLGHVGVTVPGAAPLDRPYSDASYDSFWAAAQELEMPVTFHAGSQASREDVRPAYLRERAHLGYVMLPLTMGVLVYDLITSGVCERFPGIKLVPTEYDIGWLANFLQRLDWAIYRFGGRETGLSMRPIEYWRRNFLATFEDDEAGMQTAELLGVDTLMWASDYPHADSTWPESQSTIDSIMKDCSPKDRYMMTAKNVVKLYGLPFEL